jgi:hypothetical protein
MPILRIRRRLLFALLVLAALGGCSLWWLVKPGRVTRANFDRIPQNATYDEVVAVLGPPDHDKTVTSNNGEPFRTCHWNRPHAWASFAFGASGRAQAVGFDEQTVWGFWRGWWVYNFEREPPF